MGPRKQTQNEPEIIGEIFFLSTDKGHDQCFVHEVNKLIPQYQAEL